MKILFLHYFFKEDGVTRSILNSAKGLKEISSDIEIIFAGDYFTSSLPRYIEKRYIDWTSYDFLAQIEKVSEDVDVLVFENPTVGIFPEATLAFKQFSELHTEKKIIYRIHDFVDDRPNLLPDFKRIFNNLEEIYPKSKNVCFLTLTSSDKKRLQNKGLKNVHVLPNSLIISDFHSEPQNALRLRVLLESKNIIYPDEKILLYPVRILRRKNIEEALLLTKILNEEEKYRLVVTIPFDEEYKKDILTLSEKYDIPCSVGEVSQFISFDKEDNFTISDLYKISDLVVSTSIMEGFGFVFVEPWLIGTPLIGRNISPITEDFERNEIKLSHLYDNSLLQNSKNHDERFDKINNLLSSPLEFRNLANRLNIKERIRQAITFSDNNKRAIEKYYNHTNISKQLLSLINHDNILL